MVTDWKNWWTEVDPRVRFPSPAACRIGSWELWSPATPRAVVCDGTGCGLLSDVMHGETNWLAGDGAGWLRLESSKMQQKCSSSRRNRICPLTNHSSHLRHLL